MNENIANAYRESQRRLYNAMAKAVVLLEKAEHSDNRTDLLVLIREAKGILEEALK